MRETVRTVDLRCTPVEDCSGGQILRLALHRGRTPASVPLTKGGLVSRHGGVECQSAEGGEGRRKGAGYAGSEYI